MMYLESNRAALPSKQIKGRRGSPEVKPHLWTDGSDDGTQAVQWRKEPSLQTVLDQPLVGKKKFCSIPHTIYKN